MFIVNELLAHRDINDVVPEIVYYYLFKGMSLTAIEKKIFNTDNYNGWVSKVFLNYFGIDTEGENKGIYAGRSIADVVNELSNSSNISHERVAKILKDKYI